MLEIKELQIPGYHKVIEAIDKSRFLHCFIAIHSTKLGPALGGLRIFPYNTREEAIEDVLRLSEGMTYKTAVSQVGLGGGKSVMMTSKDHPKTKEMLEAFAEVLNTLQGDYICAEDVGSNPEDMAIIKSRSAYVAALVNEQSSGDPSPFTARGVFLGIQAVCNELFNTPSLKGVKIAIQGLGHVGLKLCDFLFWEGAELLLCDIDTDKVKILANEYEAKVISSENFWSTPCDILAPCALGGGITPDNVAHIQAKAIAGAANNQLLNSKSGQMLFERNILYAPDFVINAGGIINASAEFEHSGYSAKYSLKKTEKIYKTLQIIFEKSKSAQKAPEKIAQELALDLLEKKVGKRDLPIVF